jgi:hypothetical protein
MLSVWSWTGSVREFLMCFMGGYSHQASDTVHTYDNINDTMKIIKVANTRKSLYSL